MSDSHNALIVPTLDSYVVFCSCGWVGATHGSPEPAEQEARDHEGESRLERHRSAAILAQGRQRVRVEGLSDRHHLAFWGLVVSLCIIISFIAERLVEWAAGGLDVAVAYGLSAAIGLTVGWKAAAWWDASVPSKRS